MKQEIVIYCIGDSHVSLFAGEDTIQPDYPKSSNDTLPFFKTFRLGPVLAYNLSRNGTTTRGREKLWKILTSSIPARSYVLLCFGEIDCRAHLLKQSHRQNRPLELVIQECVSSYLGVARQIRDMGHQVVVWGPSPSATSEFGGSYPTYGTQQERNCVTKQFNDCLRESCRDSEGLHFASIFSSLVTEDLQTHADYYMDGIHLSQKAMPFVIQALQTFLPDVPFGDFEAFRQNCKHSRLPKKTTETKGVSRLKRFLGRFRFQTTARPKH